MKIIVANWKMCGSLSLLKSCLEEWQELSTGNHIIIAPAFPFLSYAVLHHANFSLAAQNCSQAEEGAYTGEVSANMLAEVGCEYVIIGHSERRIKMGEANSDVLEKANQALKAGLIPIICIGETQEEYESQRTITVLRDQIEHSCPLGNKFILAYEPVWAIGKLAAMPEVIENVHALIKREYPRIPLLYGGSVNQENISHILSIKNVDGVLVGKTSLDKEKFKPIIQCHG